MGLFSASDKAALDDLAQMHLSGQKCTIQRLSEEQGASSGSHQVLTPIAFNVPCALMKAKPPVEETLGGSERIVSYRELHVSLGTEVVSGDVVFVHGVGSFDVIDPGAGREAARWITCHVTRSQLTRSQ